MIYGDVKLQQVSPTEQLAVSRRDKRRQIGCFPDRQGDNPASVCVNKNAAISPCPTMGLTPLSISRAPVIAHGALPSPPACQGPGEGKPHLLPLAPANVAGRGKRGGGTWWHRLPEFYQFSSQPWLPKKNQTRSTILFVCTVNTAVSSEPEIPSSKTEWSVWDDTVAWINSPPTAQLLVSGVLVVSH